MSEALQQVQEVVNRAFEYGSPVLYEDDVSDLLDALKRLEDEISGHDLGPR